MVAAKVFLSSMRAQASSPSVYRMLCCEASIPSGKKPTKGCSLEDLVMISGSLSAEMKSAMTPMVPVSRMDESAMPKAMPKSVLRHLEGMSE